MLLSDAHGLGLCAVDFTHFNRLKISRKLKNQRMEACIFFLLTRTHVQFHLSMLSSFHCFGYTDEGLIELN